jgi:hypothetical protein
MSERQKSFISNNSQNVHSQVQWSYDWHIRNKSWHVQKRFFFNIIIDRYDRHFEIFFFNSIECLSSITKTKVFKRFAFNKISNFDDFINKLFKTYVFIMIQLFTFLFETCIQLFYHSKMFKKVNTIILKKAKKKRLHHFENVLIHNSFEHYEQDHEIDHE